MPQDLDHRIRELAHSRPALRGDLHFVLQQFQGRACYLMEDKIKGRFFRLGLREYHFLQQLDGRRTLREIVAQFAARSRAEAFTEQEALSMVRWLADAELLLNAEASHSARLFQQLHADRQPSQLLQKAGNLLAFRIPFGNPDRLLSLGLRWLGWTLGWPFFFIWLIALCYGSLLVGQNWTRFANETSHLVAGGDWFFALIVWAVLKAIHEFWHGLMCKRFGGGVTEAGLILLVFITPLAYMDASASLRLRSKWKRMAVSAAGMYIELFLAALLAILWAHSEPGLVANAAHQGIFLASVGTLLFNINPLMRFDGYFLLADFLEIPNLAGKGQACVAYLFQRFLLGMRRAVYPLEAGEPFPLIASYGLAAGLWRLLIFVSLVLVAASLLRGLGLLLAVLVALAALCNGAGRLGTLFQNAARTEEKSIPSILLRPAAVLVLLLGLLFGVRIHESAKASAVLEMDPKSVLRAECPGFVRSVRVSLGAEVRAGELLASLENPQQTALLAQLKHDLARSQMRSNAFLREENLGAFQAEQENAESLTARIGEMETYLSTLQIRAPRNGRVAATELENLPGTYLRTGDEIATVAQAGAFKLTAAIPQEEIETFRENIGRKLEVRFASRAGTYLASLERIEPGASREIPHFALAALNGGPLVVEARQEKVQPGRAHASDSTLAQWQLAQPHFQATLSFPGTGDWKEGELARIKTRALKSRSPAMVIYEAATSYLSRKWEALQSAPK